MRRGLLKQGLYAHRGSRSRRPGITVGLAVLVILACSPTDDPTQLSVPPAPPVPIDTVQPPPPPPPPPPVRAPGECGSAASSWIWCDDFEGDSTSYYFEYDGTRAAGVGIDGSTGIRVVYQPGVPNAHSMKLAFGRVPDPYFRPVDGGTNRYRDIYWRFMVKHQAGWVGHGADKLTRAMSLVSSPQWAQAFSANVWSGLSGQPGQHNVWVDPASGTDEAGNLLSRWFNDWENFRWMGPDQSATPIFDAAHVGQWYCVETRVRLNDAGQSNGSFELWINGNRETGRFNLNWVGSYSEYGINAIFVESYWNDASPVVQERYFDNLVVSTQPIGCPN